MDGVQAGGEAAGARLQVQLSPPAFSGQRESVRDEKQSGQAPSGVRVIAGARISGRRPGRSEQKACSCELPHTDSGPPGGHPQEIGESASQATDGAQRAPPRRTAQQGAAKCIAVNIIGLVPELKTSPRSFLYALAHGGSFRSRAAGAPYHRPERS